MSVISADFLGVFGGSRTDLRSSLLECVKLTDAARVSMTCGSLRSCFAEKLQLLDTLELALHQRDYHDMKSKLCGFELSAAHLVRLEQLRVTVDCSSAVDILATILHRHKVPLDALHIFATPFGSPCPRLELGLTLQYLPSLTELIVADEGGFGGHDEFVAEIDFGTGAPSLEEVHCYSSVRLCTRQSAVTLRQLSLSRNFSVIGRALQVRSLKIETLTDVGRLRKLTGVESLQLEALHRCAIGDVVAALPDLRELKLPRPDCIGGSFDLSQAPGLQILRVRAFDDSPWELPGGCEVRRQFVF